MRQLGLILLSAIVSGGLALTARVPVAAGPQGQRTEFHPESLRALVEAISHDTTLGRPTPSPALEKAAAFVAARLSASRIEPFGDDGSWFQRFPVTHTSIRPGAARLDMGTLGAWRFGADYWHVGGMGGAPFGELRGPVVLLSGRVVRDSVAALDVRGKIVIYRSPMNARGTPTAFEAGFALGGAGALAVLVPGERPDSLWLRIARDPEEFKPAVTAAWPMWTDSTPRREGVIRFMPVLEVWGNRFSTLLERAGIDPAILAPAEAPARMHPLNVTGRFVFERQFDSVSWAPNVVARLPGTDPALRHEHIVVTAHLDGLGRDPNAPPGPGSVLNGADDNASGVAALLQVAKAMAAGPRPKRSVLFVVVSGEEDGLWGSDFFASRPPVPRPSMVANVNLDMIGRPAGDTLFLTGLAAGNIGAIGRDVVRRRPRGLVIVGEETLDRRYPGERFDERSDHVNFRRRGIPALSLFSGTHDDYHRVTDDAQKVNYDALSRITALAHDLVLALGNGDRR